MHGIPYISLNSYVIFTHVHRPSVPSPEDKINQVRLPEASRFFSWASKHEVWWSGGQVKLVSVVLSVIISNQKQLQNLRLQEVQNNELKARINLKSKHT